AVPPRRRDRAPRRGRLRPHAREVPPHGASRVAVRDAAPRPRGRAPARPAPRLAGAEAPGAARGARGKAAGWPRDGRAHRRPVRALPRGGLRPWAEGGQAVSDGFDVAALLGRVFDGHTLDRDEARDVMGRLMDGKLSQVQAAALLAALRTRGETVEEIIGFAQAIDRKSTRLNPSHVKNSYA